MSDTVFRPGFVPQTYRARVQRSAVLDRIYPPASADADIRDHTLWLVRDWRRRLNQLAAAGFHPHSAERADVDYQFARNCCPSFTRCEPRTRCCYLSCCPFCYARWIQTVWESVQQIFGPAPATNTLAISPTGERNSAQQPANLDLIIRQRTITVPFDFPGAPGDRLITCESRDSADFDAAVNWFRAINEVVIRGRQRLITDVRSVAGSDMSAIVTATIVPKHRSWQILSRQLFVVRSDANFPTNLGACDYCKRFQSPTTSRRCKSIAKVFAFPRSLLRCDARLLSAVMEARRGYRLTEKFGSFRRHNHGQQGPV